MGLHTRNSAMKLISVAGRPATSEPLAVYWPRDILIEGNATESRCLANNQIQAI